MSIPDQIPLPILFNPLKHYLPFIRDFIAGNISDHKHSGHSELIKELKHLGTCVMDIYTGELQLSRIFSEVTEFLGKNSLSCRDSYKMWVGTTNDDFRMITLSDGSQWTLKYHEHTARFVHIFPARSSRNTFRIKANTLKSAVLYLVLIGKDFITDEDLNKARALAGLSPVKEIADAEAVTGMIEMLRK